ncbi:MAG TPA: hypothetical protein DCY03_23110 [Planctomycetaceae bacterium]|nr:hypothetical protein [Planctomycetaceae bacterium]|tara:strand:+ start:125 stop:583 length:459 start_codon:yes stop_codon:yes gene_type:complete
MIPIRNLKKTGFSKPILSICLLVLCIGGCLLLVQTGILPGLQISEILTKHNAIASPRIAQQSGEVLHRFSPLSSDIANTIEIWKQDDKYQIVHRLKNGSQYVQTVIPSADLKRFTPVKARRGEFYLLTHSDSTLEAWEKDRRLNSSFRVFGC